MILSSITSCVCVVLAICAPAFALVNVYLAYTSSLHIFPCGGNEWITKKNIFGRITNRMKRGSSRCSSGFFPIRYPAERGRERGGSTTDFQAPNDALDIYTHTHILRVECARFKREKPRSFKKKIEKVCYDHVFIQCSTSYLSFSVCVYVPLSIPPCKHFKR